MESELYNQDLDSVFNFSLPFEKLQNSKILISGATGLIGSVLVDMLDKINQKKGLNIKLFLITRNKEKCKEKFSHIKTEYFTIEQDITKELALTEQFDFIIHGASNTHPKQYSVDPVGSLTISLFGTYHLLNYIKNQNRGRFVLLSTVEIYGDNLSEDKKGFSETDFGYLDCNTVRANYCEGKRASESLCQAFKSQYGVDVVIPRLCRCYGPTLKADDTKALSQFLRNGINRQDIVLKSEGNQYFSYLYAADAVIAILFTMLKGENGEAYNVSDENSNITLKNLAMLIAKKSNTNVIFDLPNEVEKAGFSKASVAILDSDKLKQLGWKATYTIEEGIERTLSCMKSNR